MDENSKRNLTLAELNVAIGAKRDEITRLRSDASNVQADSRAEIDRRNLDLSQGNNERDRDLFDLEGEIARQKLIAQKALESAVLKIKRCEEQGTAAASKLYNLVFGYRLTPQDVENAVKTRTKPEIITSRKMPYGERIEANTSRLLKIIFGLVTCLITGFSMALIAEQLDLRDPLSKPLGIVIIVVMGGGLAIGLQRIAGPWEAVGSAKVRNETAPQARWLIPATIALNAILTIADGYWLTNVSQSRTLLDGTQHLPPALAGLIGCLLSSLYLWSHAFESFAVGYNATAQDIIKSDIEADREAGRHNPVFQTYSVATKKHLNSLQHALSEKEEQDRKLASLDAELEAARNRTRSQRKPQCLDPRPDFAESLSRINLDIEVAESDLTVLYNLRSSLEDNE